MPGKLDWVRTGNQGGGETARANMIMTIMWETIVEVVGKGRVKGKARHREQDGKRGMRTRSSRHRRRGGVMKIGGRER